MSAQMIANVTKASKIMLKRQEHCQWLKQLYKKWIKTPNLDTLKSLLEMLLAGMPETFPNTDVEYYEAMLINFNIMDFISKNEYSYKIGASMLKYPPDTVYINNTTNNVTAYYGHYVPDTSTLYSRVYSIGMFEHVRCKNYIKFFKTVYDRMVPGGRFVLHTITTDRNDTQCDSGSTKNFVTEYIFPGGQIPKIEWVLQAAKSIGFKIVHIETLGGHHYAKTLHEWRQNMLKSTEFLKTNGYDLSKIKAYEYYMSECEAAFLMIICNCHTLYLTRSKILHLLPTTFFIDNKSCVYSNHLFFIPLALKGTASVNAPNLFNPHPHTVPSDFNARQ